MINIGNRTSYGAFLSVIIVLLPYKSYTSLIIVHFPIYHYSLRFTQKMLHKLHCKMLLGGLHIPKSISQQDFRGNFGCKQGEFYGIQKQRIVQFRNSLNIHMYDFQPN